MLQVPLPPSSSPASSKRLRPAVASCPPRPPSRCAAFRPATNSTAIQFRIGGPTTVSTSPFPLQPLRFLFLRRRVRGYCGTCGCPVPVPVPVPAAAPMSRTGGDNTAVLEQAGVKTVKRAVELDVASRFQESLVCYQEGIDLLLQVVKATKDETKKHRYRQKISEYMTRAEDIKKHIEKEKQDGKYHKQIRIEENAIGFSYEKVFQEYLSEIVSEVWVEDPYIRSVHQLYNFLRFCEMLVKGPCKVKTIHLLTSYDEGSGKSQQITGLDEIQQSLRNYGVTLNIAFSTSIHDREIRFNNGWMIKIGRGLDYFKRPQGRFSIGSCDFDLRPCHETTVDVFHTKHTKKM